MVLFSPQVSSLHHWANPYNVSSLLHAFSKTWPRTEKKQRISDPRTRKPGEGGGGLFVRLEDVFHIRFWDYICWLLPWMSTETLTINPLPRNMRNKLHQWKTNPGSFDARLATFRKIVEQRRTCSCTSLYLHRCCDLESQNVGDIFGAGKSWKNPTYFFWGPEICQGIATFLYIMKLRLTSADNSFKLPTWLSVKKKHSLQTSNFLQVQLVISHPTQPANTSPLDKVLQLDWLEPASCEMWSIFFSVAKSLRHCWC